MVAVIPAKSQSSRLPGKNKLELGGVPLWERAVRVAVEAGLFNKVIVSSDDLDVCNQANELDCALDLGNDSRCHVWDHDRRGWLADPARTTFEICRWVMQNEDAEATCLLLPTSPLRTAENIRVAYEEWKRNHFTPAGLVSLRLTGAANLAHDGHVLFAKAEVFTSGAYEDWPVGDMQGWITPLERSCDVNTPEDWKEAQRRFEAMKKEPGANG